MSVVVSVPAGEYDLRAEILAFAEALLRVAGRADSELSLSLVGDSEIAELNAAHRSRSGPTDVLSFSLLEGDHADFRGSMLGDVVIGLDVARRQAEEQGVPLAEELQRLLVHGFLHLLGHDHEVPEEARRMRVAEERLWREVAS